MSEQQEKRQADLDHSRIDQEEKEARNKASELERRKEERDAQTSVMQKGLPRPSVIDVKMF